MLGLSGGVDSAVAALLLKRRGDNVCGVFMKNWEGDEEECTVEDDYHHACLVAEHLDIPLYTFNFSKEYRERVFQDFLDVYARGWTPNPDILCNREIKFKAFLEQCRALGADAIATGHYARVSCEDDRYRLLKGVDRGKDQSYFLYALGQTALRASRFPLGEMTKSQVRDLAREAGLPNAKRKDSVGICFVQPGRFTSFLQRYLGTRPGPILDEHGVEVGRHQGLMFHTIGQRRGLGLGGEGEPWYVADKDTKRNALIAVRGASHPLLLARALDFTDTNWISGQEPRWPLKCQFRIRYRQNDQQGTVEPRDAQTFRLHFETPQRAVAPGQSVVLYDGDETLGGGIIIRAIR